MPEAEADRLLEWFVAQTEHAFGFLRDLGFEVPRLDGPVIQWRSSEVLLTIWMKPQPNGTFFNARLALRPMRYANEPRGRRHDVYLSDMAVATYGRLSSEEIGPYVAHRAFQLNHSAVELVPFRPEAIDRLARILRDEFMPFLRNVEGWLDDLAEELAEQDRLAEFELKMRNIRPRAEQASRDRRWTEVAKLYGPAIAELKRSERMKLEYAQRKLEEEGG